MLEKTIITILSRVCIVENYDSFSAF